VTPDDALPSAEAAATTLDRVKLLAARLRAATGWPYLATALYALSVVPAEGVPTMAVDRFWRCYVSPAFVDERSVPELAGVWLHEVSHLLRDHHGRAERLPSADRHDHRRVNVAMDIEINDELLAEGVALPAGRVAPDSFDLPAGLLFEDILRRLPRFAEREVDCGSGAHGHAGPWELPADGPAPAVGPVEAEAIRRLTADAVRRTAGTAPAGWRRWAERVLEPTVDWRQVLAGAIRDAVAWTGGAVDYTYRRPSRRSAALPGVALPSLRRPLPRVAVVVDTSGSMDADDLAAALGEITGVLRGVGLRGNRVAVLTCDAAVHTVRRVTAAEQVELVGGGGTDLAVGIRAALELPDRPEVVVVLTDGYVPWPAQAPPCRVVAGLIGERPPTPPAWVETVRITPRPA